MKNWALLLASVVVVASSITLRAQQVDQGTDTGTTDNGAVDAGAADAGGGGFGGGGGRGGRGGGRGGRGNGNTNATGGFGGGGGGGAGPGATGFGGGGGPGGGGTGFGGGGGPGGGATGFGGGGGGGRTNNLQAIQFAISSPDPEWAVLMPFVQSLIDAQALGSTNVRGMGGGGRGGRGGGGGGFGGTTTIDPTVNPVAAALQELQTALQDPNSSDELLRIRLKTYRDARDKVKNVLSKAQDSLREYLTLRQEAIMINLGYLE